MALGTSEVERILLLLGRVSDASLIFQGLKQLLPGVPVNRCDATDVDTEAPFCENETVALYFLDTSRHCVTITRSPERAMGVVVATKRQGFP